MKILCIEGLSNSGKTSLCKELIKLNPTWIWINDVQRNDFILNKLSEITHPIINYGLFDEKTEAFLYLSILSQKATAIERYLERNRGDEDAVLLVDRFALSSYAYLSQKLGDNDFLSSAITVASRGIKPDFTILLEVSIETIINRSFSSPLSRKDIHLKEYYPCISNALHTGLSEYAKKYMIVSSEEFSTIEIARIIQKNVKDV